MVSLSTAGNCGIYIHWVCLGILGVIGKGIKRGPTPNAGVRWVSRDTTTLDMVNKVYHIPQQALEVHSDLNCVTVFMSDCETQIKKLQEREERGPLYGVPVSIKEHVSYQVIISAYNIFLQYFLIV